MINIFSALQSATKKLLKSSSPILDSEVLLSSVLNKPREYVLAHPEKQLTAPQEKKFRQLVARRSKGEPIAYLTGHKEFYGLDFIVNKNVLIPRPETELLIDNIIAPCHPFVKLRAGSERSSAKRNGVEGSLTIVDMGTGSGCIAITLAKLFPRAKIFALDISEKALSVAKKNAKRYKLNKRIKFIKSNLLEKFPVSNLPAMLRPPATLRVAMRASIALQAGFQFPNNQTVIVANLPYLAKKQMTEPSIKREPRAALYGGQDGLEYYKNLLKQISQLGTQLFECSYVQVLLEIDPSQTFKIKKLIKKYLPTAKIEIKKDLAGLDRAVYINYTKHLDL